MSENFPSDRWVTVHITSGQGPHDLRSDRRDGSQDGNRATIRAGKVQKSLSSREASGANAVLDEDFARDVEEGIEAHREPWNPPSWD